MIDFETMGREELLTLLLRIAAQRDDLLEACRILADELESAELSLEQEFGTGGRYYESRELKFGREVIARIEKGEEL